MGISRKIRKKNQRETLRCNEVFFPESRTMLKLSGDSEYFVLLKRSSKNIETIKTETQYPRLEILETIDKIPTVVQMPKGEMTPSNSFSL